MTIGAIVLVLYGAIYGVSMRGARSKRGRRSSEELRQSAASLRAEMNAASNWRQRRESRLRLKAVEDPQYLVRQELLGFGIATVGLAVLTLLLAI
jgi:hypothetical protein